MTKWVNEGRLMLLVLMLACGIFWGAYESHVTNHIAEMMILRLYTGVGGKLPPPAAAPTPQPQQRNENEDRSAA
jgi:hypothetical protein